MDTAVVLKILDKPIPYTDQKSSNGNLVILICREQKPITIMLRRGNQDANVKEMCKSLDVRAVLFWKDED